ncbi:MAG: DinB family protein [Candidatus Zixiibacteriota bacterium]
MTQGYRSIVPNSSEYAQFYASYIALVPAGDIVDTLANQQADTTNLIAGISEDEAPFRYESHKWTTREVVGHMIDAERIFAYRALRIARNDKTPLAGFDENDFVANGQFESRTVVDLTNECYHVRTASLDLFRQFSEEVSLREGVANSFNISVRALAWIIAGHELHHIAILRTRYLKR